MSDLYNVILSQACAYKTYFLKNKGRFRKGAVPLFIQDSIHFGGLDVYDFPSIEQAEAFSNEVRQLKIGDKQQIQSIGHLNGWIEPLWQTEPDLFEISVKRTAKPKNPTDLPMPVDTFTQSLPFNESPPESSGCNIDFVLDHSFEDTTHQSEPEGSAAENLIVPLQESQEELINDLFSTEAIDKSQPKEVVKSQKTIANFKDQMAQAHVDWIAELLSQFEMSKNFEFFDLAASIRSKLSDDDLSRIGYQSTLTGTQHG